MSTQAESLEGIDYVSVDGRPYYDKDTDWIEATLANLIQQEREMSGDTPEMDQISTDREIANLQAELDARNSSDA